MIFGKDSKFKSCKAKCACRWDVLCALWSPDRLNDLAAPPDPTQLGDGDAEGRNQAMYACLILLCRFACVSLLGICRSGAHCAFLRFSFVSFDALRPPLLFVEGMITWAEASGHRLFVAAERCLNPEGVSSQLP